MDDTPDDNRTVGLTSSDPTRARTVTAAPRGARRSVGTGNALPAGTWLGEFELLGTVGEGGFSVVYLAQDHSLQRRVAIKEYIPATLAVRDAAFDVSCRSVRYRDAFDAGLKSFINEARLLASFDHPSLVKVYRVWEGHGTAFMAMPWYDGPTLNEAIAQRAGGVDQAWLVQLLIPLLEALGALHARNCLHRDIAPDNIILVGQAQAPVLLDFGAARQMLVTLVQELTVILKRGFAPLEQYGEVPGMLQGPWTDIYALAAVVYFAICDETPPAALGRVVRDTYRPLSSMALRGFSPEFLGAIDEALAVQPEQRPQSAQAFAQRLRLHDGQLGSPRGSFRADATDATGANDAIPAAFGRLDPGPRPTPAPSSALSRRAIWSGAAVGTLAVAALLSWSWVAREPGSAAAREPAAPSPPAPATAPEPAPPVTAAQEPAAAAVSPAAQAQAGAARARLESAVAEFSRIAADEKTDVAAVLDVARQRQVRADAEAASGQPDEAVKTYRLATDEVLRARRQLIQQLVQGYSRLAADATRAKQPGIAQVAIDRAKRLSALNSGDVTRQDLGESTTPP